MDIRIDVDKLRDYMQDYYGTAAFSGFPAAFFDVEDVRRMDGYELCQRAEREGIDLRRFEVGRNNSSFWF
ncbi:MAG: hypothetical protein Q4D06_07745 [Coriobacteriia bacterium]|nr:hypothetical protein [Coriobacteriia bacterium]